MIQASPEKERWGWPAALLAWAGVLAILIAGLVVHPSALHVIVVVLAIAAAIDRRARAIGSRDEHAVKAIAAASFVAAVAVAAIAGETIHANLVAGDAFGDELTWGAAAFGIPFVFGLSLAVAHAVGTDGDGRLVRSLAMLGTAGLLALTLIAAHGAAARPTLDRLLARPDARRIGDFASPPVCGDTRLTTTPTPRAGGDRAGPGLAAILECVARPDCDPGPEHPSAPPINAHAKTFPLETCASLMIARLSPNVVVLREAWQRPLFRNVLGTREERSSVFLRRGADWVVADDPRHLARLASAPFPWIVTGAVGVALTGFCWLLRARRRGRATVRHEGWALAIALLTSAPLAGAASAGLFFPSSQDPPLPPPQSAAMPAESPTPSSILQWAGGEEVALVHAHDAVHGHDTVIARALESGRSRTLWTGFATWVVHDTELDLVWVQGNDALDVIDLRASGDAAGIAIARGLPAAVSISITRTTDGGSHPSMSASGCDTGRSLVLEWQAQPRLQLLDAQTASWIVPPGSSLVGAAWLRHELDRAPGAARVEQRGFPLGAAPPILPKGSKCLADACGKPIAFDGRGLDLVVTSFEQGDCQHFACHLYDPVQKRFATPPVARSWGAADTVPSGSCGPYHFDRSGKRFLVETRLCTVGGSCEDLGGTAVGWLAGGVDVGVAD